MQTKEGIIKATKTIRERHGDKFWQEIGAIGGKKTKAEGCKPKGFAYNIEIARKAGALGGARSSRKGITNKNKGVDNSSKP